MKKILCFAIAALMLVAMVGCNFGSGDGEMSENTSDALTTERAETPTTEKATDKGDSTTENEPTTTEPVTGDQWTNIY